MLTARRILQRSADFLPNGTEVAVDAVSGALLAAISQFKSGDFSDANNKVVLDVISYYLQGDIEITALLEMLKAADIKSSDAAASAVTDALWLLGTQLSPDEKKPNETAASQWTNLCALTRSIHAEDLIPGDTLKVSLEFNLLSGAGIIKDEAAVRSRLVKCNTQLMYRQQKYNLLREESEGYSKLFTLLTTIPPPPHDSSAHIRYLTSVIGYFDLDPNRVVDVILDAFEQQLWNMSFVEVLGVFKRASIVHILGFKFSRYHKPAEEAKVEAEKEKTITPTAKSKSKSKGVPEPEPAAAIVSPKAPRSLYQLAVVLMSHGLVTLPDLVPYLNPTAADTGVECAAETEKIKAELRGYGIVSLSATGADLEQDSAASKVVVATAPREYADGNQLFGLLAAAYELKLLSVANELQTVLGAGGCALASSFCEEVREALIALIKWRTDPVYTPLSFARLNLAASSNAGPDNANIELPCLPGQCTQVEDLESFMAEVGPMLYTLSHHLGTNPELFTRVSRILEKIVLNHCEVSSPPADNAMDVVVEPAAHGSDPLSRVLNLLTVVMLPALTRSRSVASTCAQLLWSVLKPLPFQTRFSLYQAWKGSGLGKEGLKGPENERKDVLMCFAEAKVLHYAKAQLKRLSKDNVKQMSRSLSNATHSCPLISYTHILNSIQVFDNLIPLVVDALKYTTDLSRDVMAYALIVQLQKDSEKLKPGDTHYSQWFASLAKFIATFYRKYPSTCLEGLLHFLVGSLSKGESLDLLVLRELLTKMGACETMLDLSHNQLEGLSGGKTLQAETMGGLVKEGVPKKAVKHLRDELTKTKTAFPLLYLISKIRSTIIFNIETTELKLVSHMYDVCQDVLMQFTEFLVMGGLNGCSTKEKNEKLELFATSFPSLQELVHDGGLTLAVAFQLIRPLVRIALQSSVSSAKNANSETAKAAAVTSANVENCPAHLQRWHPFSPSILSAISEAAPEGGWPEGISMEFFSLFWSLSMYDLKLPISRYQLEIRRLRERLGELDGSGKPSADDIDKPKSVRDAELKKVSTNLKSLHNEMDQQRRHVDIVAELVLLKKDFFFATADEKSSQALYEHFVQHCVLPRLFLSPVDAVYGNQFFFVLHSIKTPKYNFQSFLEKFMKLIIPLIFSSTEYEASFLGHAINDVMILVNRWASDPDAFAKEMHHANFQKFTAIFGMWNIRLKNVIKNGIESKEYMIIRSSMVLLSKAAMNFPSRRKVGMVVLEAVENLEKAETGRSDLSLMAKSLTTMLKRRMPAWIDDDTKKLSVAAPIAPPPAAAVVSAPPEPRTAAGMETGEVTESTGTSSSHRTKKSSSKTQSSSTTEKATSGSDRDPKHERDPKDGHDSKDADREKGSRESKHKEGKSSKDKDVSKEGGRPPRAESSSSLASESQASRDKESRDSKEKSSRSGSKDRSSSRDGRRHESGNEQKADVGKHEKNSIKPAKREREESGGSTGGRGGPPIREQRQFERDNSKGIASNAAPEPKYDDRNGGGNSRKPMSSRLGPPASAPNDTRGGGDHGQKNGRGKEFAREEGEHRPNKRPRR